MDEAMDHSGFDLVGCEWQNLGIREQNCVYANRALHGNANARGEGRAHEPTLPSKGGRTKFSRCTLPWANAAF